MSAVLESDWQSVSHVWRSQEHGTEVPAELLRSRVERQSRRLKLLLVSEVLLTLLMLAFAAWGISRSGGGSYVGISTVVLLYTAGVWTFALWNRRGIWKPLGETTTDFISLLRVRAQRRVRTAHFCLAVIAAVGIWAGDEIADAWLSGSMTAWERGVWISFGVYSIGMVVWSVWYIRRARRELGALHRLTHELAGGGEGA